MTMRHRHIIRTTLFLLCVCFFVLGCVKPLARPYGEQSEKRAHDTEGGTYTRNGRYAGIDIVPPVDTLWQTKTSNTWKAGPLVANGKVYIGAPEGGFFAYTANTGTLLWSNACAGVFASACVFNNIVYFADEQGDIFACNADTGEERFRVKGGSACRQSPLVVSSPTNPPTLYVATVEGVLFSLDAQTGRVRWRAEISKNSRSAPAFADDTVVIGGSDGFVTALAGRTGRVRFRYKADESVFVTPVIEEGTIYFVSSAGVVYAVSIADGSERATFATGTRVSSSPVLVKERLLVGSEDGTLFALATKDASLRLLWKKRVESPLVMGGLLATTRFAYAAGTNGTLFAFDHRNGALVWDRSYPAVFTGRGTIADGVYYVAGDAGMLFALTGAKGKEDTTTYANEMEVSDVSPIIEEQASAGKVSVVDVTTYLNVRAAPSPTAEKVGRLFRGTRIEVLRTQNGFAEFLYNGANAWVAVDYLADEDSVTLAHCVGSYVIRLPADALTLSRFSRYGEPGVTGLARAFRASKYTAYYRLWESPQNVRERYYYIGYYVREAEAEAYARNAITHLVRAGCAKKGEVAYSVVTSRDDVSARHDRRGNEVFLSEVKGLR